MPPQIKFEIFKVDSGDENDYQNIIGYDEEMTVEEFCRRHFSDWDYPSEMEICIRESGQTEWEKYKIEVVPVPEFVLAKETIK